MNPKTFNPNDADSDPGDGEVHPDDELTGEDCTECGRPVTVGDEQADIHDGCAAQLEEARLEREAGCDD